MDRSHARKLRKYVARLVARSVIDHDDLIVGIVQPLQRPQTLLQRSSAVVRANDDARTRPSRKELVPRLFDYLAQCMQRWLRRSISPCNAERPVFDLVTAREPVVRPGKNKHAGQPLLAGLTQVPG